MDISRRRKFVICPGASVINPRHELLRAGTIISADDMPPGWIEPALRDGHIKPVESSEDQAPPPAITPNSPGRDETAPKVDGRDHPERTDTTAQVITTTPAPSNPSADEPAQVNPVVPPSPAVPSPWVLDPARLKHKSLQQLNVMVAERDSSVAPFATIPEAVAFLSKDFKKQG